MTKGVSSQFSPPPLRQQATRHISCDPIGRGERGDRLKGTSLQAPSPGPFQRSDLITAGWLGMTCPAEHVHMTGGQGVHTIRFCTRW